MKNLLVALFVTLPLVGCTQKTDDPPASTTPATTEPTAPAEPTDGTGAPVETPKPTLKTPDTCLDGQDMDAADVDVKACPAIPELPDSAMMGKEKISLGAWEIGTTAKGDTYKYGELSKPGTTPRILTFDTGTVEVNDLNLECWAKGYYRLRKILQDAPAEYVALRKAGFQYRFFQFQTDLRNGSTGYRGIASFQDHLVKWVTIITTKGVCQQPTLTQFREYAKGELTRRGLPQPGGT